jgi:hypothetical protein
MWAVRRAHTLTRTGRRAGHRRDRDTDEVELRARAGPIEAIEDFEGVAAERRHGWMLGTVLDEMRRLRELAREGDASEELLAAMGQLCAGKHPAAGILDRARNNVGFHWDADVVAPAVSDFGTNQKIVWLESDREIFVHRLAFEVVGGVLFPEATARSDEAEIQHAINLGLSNALDAVNLISTFFVKATLGYLHSIGVEVRSRVRPSRGPKDRTGDDASPRTHEE